MPKRDYKYCKNRNESQIGGENGDKSDVDRTQTDPIVD
jgi:hypothetical protein